MQRSVNLSASIETAAEALAAVLDPARGDHLLRVSPTQLRALTWLRGNPGTNVNGLADYLAVGASSASRLCDRLEALGFLRRAADPQDRREVQVLLTVAAETMLDDLSRYRQGALDQVLALMPETARQELARSLTAFSAAAEQLSSTAAGERSRRSA
jgi:DNA-binding MarR family transcriptional regulator